MEGNVQKITKNKFYVKVNDDNRIVMATPTQQEESQFEFEFPADFKIGKIYDYKIVDGKLIEDPFVYPEIEPEPTAEQLRIAELEATVALLNDVVLESIMG